MTKNLQRVPLEVSIHWHYLHQDGGKTWFEISKTKSYGKYSKATICRHMVKNIGSKKYVFQGSKPSVAP